MHILFDPLSLSLRRSDMFGSSAILDSEDHVTRPPVDVRKIALNGQTAGKTVLDQKPSQSNVDWVSHMILIRDDQSEAAFVRLFEHFAPRVKAFLMKSGADASMAEECMQEVMTTVWTKAGMFDPSRASVATWIFTIARNKKIDHFRKQKRPEPEDLPWGPEAEPDQADVISLQQETEQLGAAIAALPLKQRDLIEKAYFGELSHSEIAAETGLPLGTIKSRIRLALDRLRHVMER